MTQTQPKKIVFSELSKATQDLAAVYVDEWKAIAYATGLRTPEQRESIKENVNLLYSVSDLALPKEVIIVPSPIAMKRLYGEKALWWEMRHALPKGDPDPVLDKDDPAIQRKIAKHASEWHQVYQAGNMWPGVPCYISYLRDACGLILPEWEAFKPWEALARISGFRVVHEDFCIVSDFPVELNYYENDAGEGVAHTSKDRTARLTDHGNNRPSHLWDDGSAIYTIHGVEVKEHVVMHPEKITLDEVKSEGNAEVKRILRERYGAGRYLTDIGARVIDMDSMAVDRLAPKGVSIDRALMEDDDGGRYLVGSDGSTDRVYVMAVPSEVTTCTEAHNALSGLNESNCILEG